VALDFETTGLDLSRDEVVSLGAIPVDGGRIDLSRALYREIAPRVAPSHESVRIHHLRPQELAKAADLDAARTELREALDRRFLLTWAAEVETAFLARIFGGRRGSWRRRTTDVVPLVRVLDHLEGREGERFDRTLAGTAARFGVPPEESHHALDDALMTAELFLVVASKLEARGWTSMKAFLRQTGRASPWYG
jgi:DNA polymerase-3 subunit epsilon